MRKRAALASSLAAALVCVATVGQPAPASYNQAVQDYSSGNYGRALTEFQECKAQYPTNAMVRYYLALCEQSVGHFEQAKSEFAWVTQNGDARLKAMAQSGLAQLATAHTSVSHTYGTQLASNPSPTAAKGKIKKCIEFWAEW
jgi:TolA-binding protein